MRLICPNCKSENNFRAVNLDDGFVVACKNCGTELELALQLRAPASVIEQPARQENPATMTPGAETVLTPSALRQAQPMLSANELNQSQPEFAPEPLSGGADLATHDEVNHVVQDISANDGTIHTLHNEHGDTTGQGKQIDDLINGVRTKNSPARSVEESVKRANKRKKKSSHSLFRKNTAKGQSAALRVKSAGRSEKKGRYDGDEIRTAILGGIFSAAAAYCLIFPNVIIEAFPPIKPFYKTISPVYAMLGAELSFDEIELSGLVIDPTRLQEGIVDISGSITNMRRNPGLLPDLEVIYETENGPVATFISIDSKSEILPNESIAFAKEVQVIDHSFSNIEVRLSKASMRPAIRTGVETLTDESHGIHNVTSPEHGDNTLKDDISAQSLFVE